MLVDKKANADNNNAIVHWDDPDEEIGTMNDVLNDSDRVTTKE